MSEHLQLAERTFFDVRQRIVRKDSWTCFLHGEPVGQIDYDPSPSYGRPCYRIQVYEDDQRYEGGRRLSYVHYTDRPTNTLYAAKIELTKHAQAYYKERMARKTRQTPVAYLPSLDADFYPTPSNVAGKLLAGVNWRGVDTVLEPSAGKGDLIDHTKAAKRGHFYHLTGHDYSENGKLDVDCIEIDTNLQAILLSKGYRVVHDDFLTFNTRKRYDLYIMNPPFSNGDQHLLHALELCEHGGQIACILNAETIRNPYTNARKLLLKKLTEAGATIRFMQNAFARAQRRANVDVALINVTIPYAFVDDGIWENLRKAQAQRFESETVNAIAPSDNIERLLREYELTCDAGIALMRAYNGVAPHICGSGSDNPIITMAIGNSNCGSRCNEEDVNKYLSRVRSKFWHDLFSLPMLRSKLTATMKSAYDDLITDMKDYEFSRFNIQQVLNRIMGQLSVGVEEAIMHCFEMLSDKHTFDENLKNGNIHYFNGWKTNKAHYVNMRCIIPTWGCFARKYKPDKRGNYRDLLEGLDTRACFAILDDLEKAFNYLDRGETGECDLTSVLAAAATTEQTKNIVCKYFTVTFYKKGTCHITFHDRKIVDRLNIFVGRSKAWLPPSYGKASYDEMDEESRRVVDEFQGREAYERVVANRSDYLIDVNAQLMLTD